MVSLAENARVPVDNPATHLELTMIHEALILEYSGRHLALLEWAASLKLFAYSCIGLALFFPWGVAARRTMSPALLMLLAAAGAGRFKLAIGGALAGACWKRCRPRCASSACPSSWPPPSCWR
jgi:formate hydrogenlyase subunit 4